MDTSPEQWRAADRKRLEQERARARRRAELADQYDDTWLVGLRTVLSALLVVLAAFPVFTDGPDDEPVSLWGFIALFSSGDDSDSSGGELALGILVVGWTLLVLLATLVALFTPPSLVRPVARTVLTVLYGCFAAGHGILLLQSASASRSPDAGETLTPYPLCILLALALAVVWAISRRRDTAET